MVNHDSFIKWRKGLVVKVVLSSGGVEQVLIYCEKNLLSTEDGRKIWFNESLCPYAKVGYNLFLALDGIRTESYEILEVL